MLRLPLLIALLLAVISVRAQTAAPFPPLVYTYNPAESAPTSLVNAISTAAAPYNSILESQASDTATQLVGAFPTTATIADTNSAVAASQTAIYSSGQPGEVLSSNTRAPYTKIGTVETTLSSGTAGASATGSSDASRLLGWSGRSQGIVVSCMTALGGVAVGAFLL